MAEFNINSVTIRSDGWTADVVLDNQALQQGNVTYDYGIGTNNDPTNATFRIRVISDGYDNTGTVANPERIVYAVKTVRLPYPNNADYDETDSGSDLVVRVALSDCIYQPEGSGMTYEIDAGWAATEDTSAATGEQIITANNSTATYPNVIGGWAWPGFQRYTDTIDLEFFAVHKYGQNGKPVAAVKFTVTDESLNSDSVTVSTMTQSARADQNTVLVYAGSISTASFVQDETLTIKAEAYPWVGTSTQVIDTSTKGGYVRNQIGLCDKNNGFGVTVAYVDGVGAGTPAANDISNDSTARANPFATIAAAVDGIVAYNTENNSRENSEAGIIKLEEGNHSWTGGSNTPGTNVKNWLTITKANDATRANVVLNAQSGDNDAGNRVKFEDITITNAVSILINNVEEHWTHNCTLNHTGTAYNYSQNPSYAYYTMNTITALNQGLRPFSTRNLSIQLVRGNIVTPDLPNKGYVILGNKGQMDINADYASQTVPVFDNRVIAFNFIQGDTDELTIIQTNDDIAVIQNIFERTGGTALMVDIQGSASDINNVLLWYNTTVGERLNLAYNDVGSTAYYKNNWSLKNNLVSSYSTKTDVFGADYTISSISDNGGFAQFTLNTSSGLSNGDVITVTGTTNYDGTHTITGISGANVTTSTAWIANETPVSGVASLKNGSRVGNWASIYSTGYQSNYFRSEDVNQSEFDGFYTRRADPIEDAFFVDDASQDGTGLGNGDYHLTENSTQSIGRSQEILLPYDIEGSTRFIDTATNGGAIGAYEYGIEPVSTTGKNSIYGSGRNNIYGQSDSVYNNDQYGNQRNAIYENGENNQYNL